MTIRDAKARQLIREDMSSRLLTTSEVEEILDVSRARISQLVKNGMLTPVKYGVYLKDDIYAYKEAFDDARENNEWLKEFK